MLVSEKGEAALLQELRALFAPTSEDVPLAVGDDAAIINQTPGCQMVWSADLFLEDIHFRRGWMTPWQIGRKCMAVNVSDIAAMGGVPRYALLSLACAGSSKVEFIIEMCRGFRDLALEEGIAVIGGDTSASASGLLLSVAVGGLVPDGGAVRRSGARPGDVVMVTGYLGSAAAGLRLFREGMQEEYPELARAFAEPVPQLEAAGVAGRGGASAMTDISDGLAVDLGHVCEESGVGARIEYASLPVNPVMLHAARANGWDEREMVLAGGEEYELLITAPPVSAAAITESISSGAGLKATVIGTVTPGSEMVIVEGGKEQALGRHGFDHFLKR